MVSQAFFAVGVALLSLLAYVIQEDWRMFTQAVTLLGLPFVFLIAFLLPESPRWLQSQGQNDKAVKVLKHIAAKNGAQWKEVEFDSSQPEKKITKKRSSDTLASLLTNKEVNNYPPAPCVFLFRKKDCFYYFNFRCSCTGDVFDTDPSLFVVCQQRHLLRPNSCGRRQ